jgi:hypothetical protein
MLLDKSISFVDSTELCKLILFSNCGNGVLNECFAEEDIVNILVDGSEACFLYVLIWPETRYNGR